MAGLLLFLIIGALLVLLGYVLLNDQRRENENRRNLRRIAKEREDEGR